MGKKTKFNFLSFIIQDPGERTEASLPWPPSSLSYPRSWSRAFTLIQHGHQHLWQCFPLTNSGLEQCLLWSIDLLHDKGNLRPHWTFDVGSSNMSGINILQLSRSLWFWLVKWKKSEHKPEWEINGKGTETSSEKTRLMTKNWDRWCC